MDSNADTQQLYLENSQPDPRREAETKLKNRQWSGDVQTTRTGQGKNQKQEYRVQKKPKQHNYNTTNYSVTTITYTSQQMG